jgi:hypothetical protein
MTNEKEHLLYYNPNIATHQENHALPGVERFSKFFQIFNPTVVFIDRTDTIKIPIRAKSIFPMPEFRPMQKTFEEICNERAKELLDRSDRLGAEINVFYSGGIDSTLLLISLLKNATPEQKMKITVLMSEESIMENPNFYRDHIRGKLRTASAAMFPYLLGSKQMLIGGEHNDQLFGSDMVGKLITRFDPSIMHQLYNRDNFFKFFNEKIDDPAVTNFYLDLFERLKDAAPVPVSTHFDFLWWINFSLKWQSVFMRMLSYAAPRNVAAIDREYIASRYVHFYGTEDFQLWSMNNMDKKIKDKWNTYKWPCKDIIYDYTGDAEYRDNKIKRGSLYFLLLQQDSYNFIDESMKFYKTLDPAEYYNPDNDFI